MHAQTSVGRLRCAAFSTNTESGGRAERKRPHEADEAGAHGAEPSGTAADGRAQPASVVVKKQRSDAAIADSAVLNRSKRLFGVIVGTLQTRFNERATEKV